MKPQVEEEVIAIVGTGRGRRGLLLEAFIRQLARMDEPVSWSNPIRHSICAREVPRLCVCHAGAWSDIASCSPIRVRVRVGFRGRVRVRVGITAGVRARLNVNLAS